MLKKKLLTLCSVFTATAMFFFASRAYAADSGWDTIRQISSFSSNIQVVLDSDTNSCTSGTTIYNLDPSNEHLYQAALSAFLSGREVKLQYVCVSGDAEISGVRVR